jgi:hypothetical protein
MDDLGFSAAIMVLGPALLVLLIYRRERELYGDRSGAPDAGVMRAPCSRCGAALVAAELLYVISGGLVCESCRRAAGERGRGLSEADLALLNSGAVRATSRRR